MRVDIKGVGPAEFPNDMSEDQVRDFLRNKYSQPRSMQEATYDTLNRAAIAAPEEESLEQRTGRGIADKLYEYGIVTDKKRAFEAGNKIAMGLGYLPPVGAAYGGDEFGRAAREDDYLGMAIGTLEALGITGEASQAVIGAGILKAKKLGLNKQVMRLLEVGMLKPDAMESERAVKSAMTKYNKFMKESPAFRRREQLAAENDFGTIFTPENVRERKIVTPEDMVGNTLVPVAGDTSDIGTVSRAGGIDIDPVDVQGGNKFIQKYGGWASAKEIAERKQKAFDRAAEQTGKPVLGVYNQMSEYSTDFSTPIAEIMHKQAKAYKIPKPAIKAFDAEFRKSYPSWVGLDDPYSLEQLMGNDVAGNAGLSGKARTVFSRIMGKADYRNAGFPIYNDALLAANQRELANYNLGDSGYNMFQADIGAPVTPFGEHKSYNAQIAGTEFGGLDEPSTLGEMFPTALNNQMNRPDKAEGVMNWDRSRVAMNQQNKGENFYQEADQQWLDNIMTQREARLGTGNITEPAIATPDQDLARTLAGEQPEMNVSLNESNLSNEGLQNATSLQGQQPQLTSQAREESIRQRRGLSGGDWVLEQQSGPSTGYVREKSGNLQGLPTIVKGFKPRANPQINKVAESYLQRMGQAYRPPQVYADVDPKRAATIADEFDRMEHNPQDPEVREAYQQMIDETMAQYDEILKTGFKPEFIDFDKMGDPYSKSPRQAIDDINNNNHMWVFSTRDGFGSDETFDPADNPLLQETEYMISGEPALANDIFRVVHDYFGHGKEGVGFRAAGEENAWRSHAAMYSPKARRALTTETRGQNSWVNYGPYGEKNRTATAEDTKFADQKIGLLPEWVSESFGDADAYLKPERRGSKVTVE